MVDLARTRRSRIVPSPYGSIDQGSLEGYAIGLAERVKQFARDEPISFGLWAFGIGFLVGWRLKPW